jgi:multiple sugar transport system substrate-binding protein
MARVTRRKFLKVSGAGTVAAKVGGMAGILAAGKAPAYAQTTTVHWIRWNDFVRHQISFCARNCCRG